MVGAFISVSVSPVSGFSQPSRRMLTTDWLTERLPAEAIAMMRWPGRVEMWSLRKVAKLSTPAFVGGVGAGVGEHHETVAHEDAAAIGHDVRSAPCPAALYTDPGGKPAMLPQFWICCAACSTRTRTESASPAPP